MNELDKIAEIMNQLDLAEDRYTALDILLEKREVSKRIAEKILKAWELSENE